MYVGEPIAYTISLTNKGPSTAYNLVIEDSFTTDIPFSDLDITASSCPPGTFQSKI